MHQIVLFGSGIAQNRLLRTRLKDVASVTIASEIQQLYHTLDHFHPDILLFEISKDSPRPLQTLKQITMRYPDIRVLALNGSDDRCAIAEAISCGVCDVFRQPYRYDLIVERIKNL
jgi:DNA-binding NarL/FixJ family response regulator